MKAKIADFGLLRYSEGTSVAATRVMGTPGYVDPAYCRSQKATPMADVYSFGVVMLTVLTARKAVFSMEAEQAAFKDPHLEALDRLVLQLARLALSCIAMPTASRPSTSRC
ncbi:hypothetical protein CLOP_g12794 [Closterium sp. NIES-67]|nr:hypothetical protein CLOP_g12794 [Closterium sp. NIES-67]